MKAKKAAKKLSSVEAVLSDVLNRYATQDAQVHKELEIANAAVKRARLVMDSNHSSGDTDAVTPSKPSNSRPRVLTAEARRKMSLAAKRRWAGAKRKGIHRVTAAN